MKFHPFIPTFACGLVLGASTLSAQIVTASQAGQYTAAGDYSGGSNYVTGAFEGEYRGFFVFNLPTFSTPIVGARLDIFNAGETEVLPPGFYSEDGSETLSFFQYSGSISSLVSGGSGLTGIFDDLGSGTGYGSVSVSAAANGQYVSLFLNADFLSDLNAASGGSIAIGSALTSLADPAGYEFVFGNTDLSSATPAVRLTLTAGTGPGPSSPVPESSTYALFASASLAALIVARKAKRRSSV